MTDILAADIGGTHSRFAAFSLESGRLALLDSVWLETGDADSFAGLLDLLAASPLGRPPEQFGAVVLAVPGPVEDGLYSRPANIPWAVDARELAARLPVAVINDFAAQAWACLGPAVEGAAQVLPGRPDPKAALGVIGAGTGLGHAAVVDESDGGRLVVPSEAGHSSFPFLGRQEEDFHRFLRRRTKAPYATGDLVVSGSGLACLHAYLTGKDLSPAQVARAIGPDSPTTEWFARFYGRAARNYALAVLARRGLYIAGGVAAKNPFLVMNDTFRREFVDSPVYGRVLQNLPVWLNENELSGLWGAAGYAVQLLARRKG